MKSPSVRQYNLPDAKSISHHQDIGTRCKSPPDNVRYFKQLGRYFSRYQGFQYSEKSINSVNFQVGFTFANTTRKRIFKGLDFVFSTLFPPTFFMHSVLNQKSFSNLFSVIEWSNCFQHMGIRAANEVTNIRYPQFWMDHGWCCAKANLGNTC